MADEIKKEFDSEINKLIEAIERDMGKTAYEDKERVREGCNKLLEYAAAEQSDELYAVYYSLCMEFIDTYNDDALLENYALEGIKYHRKTGRISSAVKMYMSLASYVERRGDTLRQVLYLYEGMELASSSNMYYECAIFANSLSVIYRRAGEYVKAGKLAEQAEDSMEMSGKWDMDRPEFPIYTLNKGYAYIASKRVYEAKKCVRILEQYVDYTKSVNKRYPAFLIHTFFASFHLVMGVADSMREHIQIAKDMLPMLSDLSKYTDDVNQFIDVMQAAGFKTELKEVLNYLIGACRRENLPFNNAIVLYKKRIELAILEGDSTTASELELEILSVYERSTKSNNEFIKSAEQRFYDGRENEKRQREMLERNEQLRLSVERAKTENQAKSDFISSMSHEIRTPINAVLGLDEMIIRESSEDSVKNYAYDILNAGNTLLSIINDILDFSKIEAGKMQIVPQEYEFKGILRDLYNLINPRAKTKNLEVKFNIDEGIPTRLYGDDIRVKQVITNLLTNAVKYTDEGHVELNIGYESLEDDKVVLCVSVADTGIGMKEEELDKLFKPFERLDMNRNRTVEGTGLGMSIVLNMLNQMNSRLDVESTYGEGSTFSFKIDQGVIDNTPIGKVDISKIAPTADITKDALFTAHRARILAVDDTPTNLTVVKGLLKRNGIKVDTAESGTECLEKCKNITYDAILLDHRMPGLDGMETLQLLRSEPGPNRETPVVALTANVTSGIDEFYTSNGFTGYLAKPINGLRLEKTLLDIFPAKLLDTKEDIALAIDEEEGIKACGSEEIYAQVVKETIANEKMIVAELKSLIDSGDIRNYTVKVHALKNTARMIGATGVSKEAAYMEKCGDEGRENTIYAQEGELIAHFEGVLKILAEKYSDNEEGKAPFQKDKVVEGLNEILKCTESFDFDRADEIMADIRKLELPKSMAEPMEKLANALYNYDADNIIIYTKECLTQAETEGK